MQAQVLDNGDVITPAAILSYPKLFEPELVPNRKSGGDATREKYGASFVFPPDTPDEDIKTMKRAAFQVAVEKFGEEKAKSMLQKGQIRLVGGSHHTFRTDALAKGHAEGSIFINSSSYGKQPQVIDGQKQEITDPARLYPGAIVRAHLSPYWYDNPENKGIGWALNSVQFIRDGERLDGRIAATDAFGELEPADLGDLEEELEGVEEDLVEEAPAPIAKKAPKAKKSKKADEDLLDELLA